MGRVHILDPNSLEEMKLQSLEDIVKKHVDSKVEPASDKIRIEVAVDGVPADTSTLDKAPGDAPIMISCSSGVLLITVWRMANLLRLLLVRMAKVCMLVI